MRGSWDRVPLSAVCASADDIKCGPFGTQLKRDEFRSKGVPLWGIKHVNANFVVPTDEFLDVGTARRLQQYDLKPSDIVMTRKGTVGNCAIYPENGQVGIMHSDLLRLRVDLNRCDPLFLVHQLRHSPDVERQLALISGGAIMPGINVGRLKQLEVVVPPLPEQRRIAELLDRAEALRAKRRAALAQLDTLTQSIFLEMFGDPVTNPKGWPLKRIGEIAKVVTGNTPPREIPDYYGSAIEWIKSDNVNTPHYFLTKAAEGLSESGMAVARTAPAGSILVTCIAGSPDCIGNSAMADREVAFNQQINALVPRIGDAHFLYAQIRLGKRLVQAATTGGMKGMVSKGRLEQVRLMFPTPELQRELAIRLSAVAACRDCQVASQSELDELFSSLQHRAFRGEL